MCLNGRLLVRRSGNKAWDSFLLYLTLDGLHSVLEVIILRGTSAGVGEAHHELTSGNIAIDLTAWCSWINESSFGLGHCEC